MILRRGLHPHRIAIFAITIAFLLSASTVCLAVTDRQLTGRGAFLIYKAETIGELIAQIRGNKSIAARYEKHYGASADDLIRFLETGVRVERMGKSQKVTNYFYSKEYKVIGSKMDKLDIGTAVLVTNSGELFMKLYCGNPLTKKLPKIKVMASTSVAAPVQPVVKVASGEPMEVRSPAEPSLIVEPEPVVVAQLDPRSAQPWPEPRGSIAPPPALAYVIPALLGAVAVQKSSTPEVPEPASLTVLLTGLGWVSARRVRRRG